MIHQAAQFLQSDSSSNPNAVEFLNREVIFIQACLAVKKNAEHQIFGHVSSLFSVLNRDQELIKKQKVTFDFLRCYLNREITRLNHWYIWNGRYKATQIQKALNTMENKEKKTHGRKK